MMKRHFIVTMLVLVGSSAHARDVGTVGATYPIAEKDALAEIEEKARGIDWSRLIGRKAVEGYDGPADRVRLPRVERERRFAVDMTYTLETDIPDGRGGVLYPKGYAFNPLDYVTFAKTLVVINGNDPDQVRWFASSEYRGRMDVTLLVTEGAYRRLGKELGVPLFYADSRVIGRLGLAAVPSVVSQEGRFMVVRELVPPSTVPGKNGGTGTAGGRNRK